MRSLLLIVFTLIYLFSPQVTKAEEPGFWDLAAKRPDAKITVKKTDTGKKLRTATFEGGVVYKELKEGGLISYDTSGHGAVLCTYEILLTYKKGMDACSVKDKKIHAELDKQIDRIQDFIVKNSVVPATKDELIQSAAQAEFGYKQRVENMSDEEYQKNCVEMGPKNLQEIVFNKEFDQELEELLSVPRPPAFNPCL